MYNINIDIFDNISHVLIFGASFLFGVEQFICCLMNKHITGEEFSALHIRLEKKCCPLTGLLF